MAPFIFDWKTFKESDIKFTIPAKKAQAKITFIKAEVMNYDTQAFSTFYHQAPQLSVPFGIEKKDFDDANAVASNFNLPNKLGRFASIAASMATSSSSNQTSVVSETERYNCCLRLSNISFDTMSESFHGDTVNANYAHFLTGLDNAVKTFAAENSQTLFGSKQSKEVIGAMYYPIIKHKADSLYPPTINARVLINTKDELQGTTFYDEKGVSLKFDELRDKRNFNVVPILSFDGFWAGAKQFGASFKVVQMVVFQPQDAFIGCCVSLPSLSSLPSSVEDDEGPIVKSLKEEVAAN